MSDKPNASIASPEAERFEKFVDALLKVDPSGLSGKHKAKKPDDDQGDDAKKAPPK